MTSKKYGEERVSQMSRLLETESCKKLLNGNINQRNKKNRSVAMKIKYKWFIEYT